MYSALINTFDNGATGQIKEAFEEAQDLFLSLKAYGADAVKICNIPYLEWNADFRAFCIFTAMYSMRIHPNDMRFLEYYHMGKDELIERLSRMFPHTYTSRGEFDPGIPYIQFIEDRNSLAK